MDDLWEWLSEKMERYRASEDYDRYSVGIGFQYGAEMIHTNPENALSFFEKTRDRANELGEPWWALLCEHWSCQTMLYYSGQIDEARRIAEASIEIVDGGEDYADFPQRVCLHDDRANALQTIDPVGGHDQIIADCDYIDREGSRLESCSHCARSLRIDDAIAHGDLDIAESVSLDGLGRCRSNTASHYVPQYMTALCRISRLRNRWDKLLHWAAAGEQYYGKMGDDLSNIELLMWHALALLTTGDVSASRAAYLRARQADRQTRHIQTVGYYDALADYHELSGRFGAAIDAHARQIESRTGAAYVECRSRLARVRLMRVLGRAVDAEVDLLRAAAAGLKDPSIVMAELDAALA